MEKVSDRKPVINPVQDITPDGRPMEGTAYPEHSALGVSLDSGLRAGMSSIEPMRNSVLNTCFKSSARPMLDHAMVRHTDVDDDIDTDLPENPAPMMNSQTNHEQSWFKSSARPMLDPAIINHTDVDDDIDTDLPENPVPMRNSQTDHEQSWFESSARPMLDPDEVDNTVVNADVNTDLPENSAPMMNLDLRLWQSDAQLCPPVADTLDRLPIEGISGRLSVNSPGLALAPDSGYVKNPPHPSPLVQGALGVNRRSDNLDSFDEPQFGSDRRQSSLELEDAIRREVLKSRSMGRVSARDGNGLLLSPENAGLGDKDMSLDEVRSEGLRR